MRHLLKRKAFTMIELLFVIVILGIVGGIALETVRQYYDGVYKTITTTKRVIEADQILDQLTKYFENGISSSIVNLDINPATVACYGPPQLNTTTDYTIAFIGVDQDSLRGVSGRPGWSEEAQLISGTNDLNMSDANLTMANDVITALGSTLSNSAIYDAESVDTNACVRFNYAGEGREGFHRISSVISPTRLALNTENNASNGHRKYLLRTGYAFRVEDDGRFLMYSGFRPWVTTPSYERFSSATKVSLLGQNVAHFYADYDARDFQNNVGVNDRGLVWRLKVCMRGFGNDLADTDENATQICRERRVHVRY